MLRPRSNTYNLQKKIESFVLKRTELSKTQPTFVFISLLSSDAIYGLLKANPDFLDTL